MTSPQRLICVLGLTGAGVAMTLFMPVIGYAHEEKSPLTVEHRVIVQLKTEPTEQQRAWGTAAIGSPTLESYAPGVELTPLSIHSQGQATYLLTSPSLDSSELMDQANRDAKVASVQPDFRYQAQFTPNDPQYSRQWNLPLVHAPEAWDLDTTTPLYGGDPSIVVAVLDTGVAYENYNSYKILPDFAATNFTAGYDFVNNDSHPNDDNGHGTHVAGTIAATTNNAAGAAGIAFASNIMPVKILDSTGGGSTSTIAQGVDFARVNGARVINLSLGGSSEDPVLHAAVTAAKNAGIVVVAATGNNAEASLLYPAAYAEAIAVGAVRFDKARAPYSNYGTNIDIMAPGGDLEVDQNSDDQPDGVLQETCTTTACTDFNAFYYEGTSQAAPHVSAAASLLLAAGGSSASIQGILESTALDLGAAGYDTQTGYGLLDINAALTRAMGDTTPPSGSLTINGGAAVTSSPAVSLVITASDSLGTVTEMSFSNDGTTFSSWEAYATTKASWNIEDAAYGGNGNEGTKSVFVRFIDASENVSSSASDTIVLDLSPPAAPTIRGWTTSEKKRAIAADGKSAALQPTFSFTTTDNSSGVGSYLVSLGSSVQDPSSGGTAVTVPVYSVPSLSEAGTYVLSVRAIDQVGNISAVSSFTWHYQPQGVVVVTGNGERPRVKVYDANGTLVSNFPVFGQRDRGGLSVAAIDLDSDGQDEILVGSGPGQAPEVRVYSLTGRPEQRIRVRDAKLADGVSVAVGNVRGSSAPEIIAGSISGSSEIRIFSSQGKLLKKFSAFANGTKLGTSVAVGDFQGKGQQEIAVAQHDPSDPVVRFFSGTGRLSKTIKVTSLAKRGLTLGSGDIDADGLMDLFVGEASGPSGQVAIVHRTGKKLGRFRAYAKSFTGGVEAIGSDLDGDGIDEIVTAPTNRGSRLIKTVTLQGKTEPGIRTVIPAKSTPDGGYRLASIFLTE